MQPTEHSHPLYIVSKGRHDSRHTSKALEQMGCRYFMVVEPQEVDAYRAVVSPSLCTVLPLDMAYKDRYDTLDNLGQSKSTGPGPARNFAWDHSISLGHSWHWVMDDNIMWFGRLHQNTKYKILSPRFWAMMEVWCARYSNLGMAGPNYEHFLPRKVKRPPFITNTRIYSCNLIRNDLPFRWRGRYNEDTILSLDLITAGWCTVQFNAFYQKKMGTQRIGGGNTAEFYANEGTLPKSKMLVRTYPRYARLVWKFNRWHHTVDYSSFQRLHLKLDPGVQVQEGVNEFGLALAPVRK